MTFLIGILTKFAFCIFSAIDLKKKKQLDNVLCLGCSVHCEETEEKTSAVSPSPSQSTIKSYDFHRLTAILDKLVQEG